MVSVCAATPVKEIWRGRDNAILLRLDRTNRTGVTAPFDLSVVSKMTLQLNTGDSVSTDFGEVDDPAINWWDQSLLMGEVSLVLGHWVESIGLKNGNYTGVLVLFGPVSPDGVVWSDGHNNLLLKVIDG